MRGSKYLMYFGALMVTIWGVNGVLTTVPESRSDAGSVMAVQDRGPSAAGQSAQLAPIAITGNPSHGR